MEERPYPLDPFGETARRLLARHETGLSGVLRSFALDMHGLYGASEEVLALIGRLLPQEREALIERHAIHLLSLLSPDTDAESIATQSERSGLVHAYLGVDLRWVFQATCALKDSISDFLDEHEPDEQARVALWRVIRRRVDLGTEAAIGGYRNNNRATAAMVASFDENVMMAANPTDLIRSTLQILCEGPGDMFALYSRPDNENRLRVELYCGERGERYYHALEIGEYSSMETMASKPTGQGPGGRAWRSGEVTIADAWMLDASLDPWHPLGMELGIRSSVGIPLLDESGRSIALISLYSVWPGFFSNASIRGFLQHIQLALSAALMRMIERPVVPVRLQQTYRRLLAHQSVRMHYQPVIDLRATTVSKLEALARLIDEEGKVIAPGLFLSAFGREELYALFAQGLEQICRDIPRLESLGLSVPVSLNFPAEGFGDARYGETLTETLRRHHVAHDRIHLEILETQESPIGIGARLEFLQGLRQGGIRLVQDDLGSGHSSLLRLENYPFDEVKIDQGLVRGALRSPRRVVEFIFYLTRLAHALGLPVTVEGLENRGLIEAAMILGADYGQGYGFATPMPIEALAHWGEQFTFGPPEPQTAMGALAAYLQCRMLETHPNDHALAALTQSDQLSFVEEYLGTLRVRVPADAPGQPDVIEELTRAWLAEIAPSADGS